MPQILAYLARHSESTRHFSFLLAAANILTAKWHQCTLSQNPAVWGSGLPLFLDNVCIMYSTEEEAADFVQSFVASPVVTVTAL